MKVSRSQWRWSHVAGVCGMVLLTMLPVEPSMAAGGMFLGGSSAARNQFRPLLKGSLFSLRSQKPSRRMLRMPVVALPAATVDVVAPLAAVGHPRVQVVQAGDDGTLDSQFRPIERDHLGAREADPVIPAPGTLAPYGQWPMTGYQGLGALPYAITPPAVPAVPPVSPIPYIGSPYGYGTPPVPNPYLGLPYGYSILPPAVAPPFPSIPVPVAPYPQLPYPVSPLLAPPLWPY